MCTVSGPSEFSLGFTVCIAVFFFELPRVAWEDEEPGSCDLSVQLMLDLLGLSSFVGVVIAAGYKFRSFAFIYCQLVQTAGVKQ